MSLKKPLERIVFAVASVVLIAACAFVFKTVWRDDELAAFRDAGAHRLAFAASQIQNEIGRQDHIHRIIALDPDVKDVLKATPPRPGSYPLHRKLAMIGTEANTAAIYVVARNGMVISASDNTSATSVLGTSHLSRPYFLTAISQGSAAFFGIDPATGRTSYFLAEAVRETDGGNVIGLTVVKIDFSDLEASWEAVGEKIIVTDENGVVLLTGTPAWRYKTLAPLTSPLKAEIVYSDRYVDQRLDPLDIVTLDDTEPDRMVRIREPGGTSTYLVQHTRLFEHGWTVRRLTDVGPLQTTERDGAIIGGTLAALAVMLALYVGQRQRALSISRRAQARLQWAVELRTRELREANKTLHAEFTEQRRMEAQLRQIQGELLQAGKMAALGQMSAALAHEINQPLTAIATFTASARILDTRGDRTAVRANLDEIAGLTERMARITSNLKRFARKGQGDPAVPLHLRDAVDRVLILVGPQARSAGIAIESRIDADAEVIATPVLLEQVILNLLQNAMDALSGAPDPRIRIEAAARGEEAVLRIVDNGAGIAEDVLDRLFEPFFTTKPSGVGLGLGLSISHGIIESFGGRLTAANLAGGGAEMVIVLPRHVRRPTRAETLAHA
ncbi:sensor histidine kinase [Methylobrevis pamukkalensis]|uniref:C4-dicarboxylate transport sensor protein DctB n=1 Tax=Methylobrevis pamukkalensis TaxID=1439726 RepID=A0A1E3H8G7_9HYPH|nr:ATP-binding protein [Methylobrevis pamukkalensis]ODN72628.1 C4-dicarboxylate transport sensor protein DctB [Methylobrevis pamukkalensis]